MAMMLLLLLQLLILVIRFVAIVFVVARGLASVVAAIAIAIATAIAIVVATVAIVMVMAEKLLGLDLVEHVAGIVDALLGPHRLTSVREPDTSLQIGNGTEHEISVHDGLVEIAGISQLPLQTKSRYIDILIKRYSFRALHMQFMSSISVHIHFNVWIL